MNLEIANRLVEYRKRAGYSQEELADKLGISRQAVSKWERVEASPDTDNLIALANLYGVSLDELINGKKDPDPEPKKETVEPEQTVEDDGIHIGNGGVHLNSKDGSYVHIDGDGIHTCNKKGEKHHFGEKELERRLRQKCNPVVAVIWSVCSILALILFFVLGFQTYTLPCFDAGAFEWTTHTINGFQWTWVFFVAIPIIPSFVQAIVYKKITAFNFAVLCTVVFLASGALFNMWHPMWIVFLVIPLFYSIFGPVDHYATKKRAKELGVNPQDLDKDYDPNEYHDCDCNCD